MHTTWGQRQIGMTARCTAVLCRSKVDTGGFIPPRAGPNKASTVVVDLRLDSFPSYGLRFCEIARVEYRTRGGFGYLVWRQRFTMSRRAFSLPHTLSSSEMTWSPGILATGNDSANESARPFRAVPVRSPPVQIVPCQEAKHLSYSGASPSPRAVTTASVSGGFCVVVAVDSACVVNHKGRRSKTFAGSGNAHLRSSEAIIRLSPSFNDVGSGLQPSGV